MIAPKVSVVMLTYYHEKYVKKALDSILGQRTNFSYELLVGDDGSKDRTQGILREYKEKYPDIVRLTLRERNIGASRNFCDVIRRAKGEYIAHLDGDDYWTDPDKLQKQVDFLDTHREYVGCAHKFVVVDDNDTADYTIRLRWARLKKIFTLDDFLENEDMPSQAGTFMFRNVISDYSPLHRIHPIVCDKTLMFMLLLKGNFYGINQVMSAYRLVIDKDNGKNWFSIHHSNPYWQYDAFMRPVKLEEYARSLGIDTTIGPRRDYHYTSLIENIITEPSLTRFKQIAEMTIRSRNPLHCLGLVARYLISC